MVEGSYTCGVSDIPLRGETIGAMLNQIAVKYPDTEALVSVHQGIRYTYREFLDEVEVVARGLMALGVERGDRVAIWALNYAEWVIVQFATAKIGAIMVNINPAYRTYELEYALKQSEVQTLIIQGQFKTSDYLGMFYEACPEVASSRAGRINSDTFPYLKNVIFLGDEPKDGMFLWKEIHEMAEDISPGELKEREEVLEFDDPINIQYTSGTTGYPKGVVLSHHSILNNGFVIGEGMRFSEKDRLCIPVPFYHCFGMVLSNLACVTHGSTMVLPAPVFNAEAVLKAVQDERCTALHGVPTMFIAELSLPDFDVYKLDTLRTGIMAGSPCPIEVMKEVNTRMHMSEIVIVYGQTETSPGVTMSTVEDPLERRVSTVGRAMPHAELKIVDPQTRRLLPRGEPGEICARGYMVMKCYYNNPSATHSTIDPNGWNHTGDLGVMDEEGYIRIVGRLKEMVIRGGENIYPREIEEFLHHHPKIDDAYIIGVPDIKYGEELMAWVKVENGDILTEEDIRAFCKGKIAHYKVPKYYKFVDSFPMTISGKIQKFKMRQQAVEELGLQDAEKVETA
ncbi:MAG: AMP-dependent synthetase/ligase [Methanomicrobiales archaeon 53_19]|uniref:AMP-binding protein n=1 Tax=Methanocalculus sp. TaxID=2004547 RepID=UPI00074932AB|nr:AMP-binding protein [Methanocalculus sp.]KUK71486.1 MAG: AMP-dependent synthetase/ligase [Methanocalculus sp. 52_23]KUL04108.1 MAG: AMP-dependent synthetase/ligase [Methanomicrobiales archaeon 53_19]HIJ07394.1 AMP-binding protein [Methanocalculus sp.]